MRKVGVLLKNGVFFVALFMFFAASLCFAQEEITFTTIMPRQDELRVQRGIVGNHDWDESGNIETAEEYMNLPGATIGDNNLRVAGNILTAGSVFFHGDADGVIGFNYPDTDYDRRMRVTAGESDTGDNSQGASIDLHGNAYDDLANMQGRLDLVAGRHANGNITFWTGTGASSPFRRMTIESDGDVCIGVPSTSSKLHVTDPMNTAIYCETTADSTGPDGIPFYGVFGDCAMDPGAVGLPLFDIFDATQGSSAAGVCGNGYGAATGVLAYSQTGHALIAESASGFDAYFRGAQGVVIRSLTVAGVGQVAEVWVDGDGLLVRPASDRRLKKNIVTISDELDVIDTLKEMRGVYFNWNTDHERAKDAGEQREIGMIAQEVEEYIPEVIGTDKNGYKSLSHSKMVAFLIEVNKAQQEQIEELNARVETIENQRD